MSDADVLAELEQLASAERGAVAHLIAHLVVLDVRGAHLALGHSSLFAYCRDGLHMAEHEAYNRIEVARAARAFPQLLGLIHDGALTPTSARLLAPILTRENSVRLLAAAAYRSKREVEELIARERPRADMPASVSRLPVLPIAPSAEPTLALLQQDAADAADTAETPPPLAPAGLPQGPALIVPLSTERYGLRFTVGASTREKLELARDLLRHALPSGDVAQIFDRALTLLLEHLSRQRFGVVRRPRGSAGERGIAVRDVGADVKRIVYLRDAGRCAFVSAKGRRCNSRAFLEFHHVKPYAAGGEATEKNIELRCRAHNQYEAQLYFGPIQEARERRLRYA